MKYKHKTHRTIKSTLQKIKQNTRILDMNCLCKRLPDSKLDSSNSLLQRVYTILASNCHKAARCTSIARQHVQKYITISVHFLLEQ